MQFARRAAFEEVHVAGLSVLNLQLCKSPALTELLAGFGCNRRLIALYKGRLELPELKCARDHHIVR